MIRICDVSECVGAIDFLVAWNSDYWSDRTPEVTSEQWRRSYEECVGTRGREIPVTLVGLEDGRVFGGVTIVKVDDIQDFPDYSPWIAALIVGETYRGKNLGLTLMDAALAKVRKLGYSEAFLWTDSRKEWYVRQGWYEIHHMTFGKVEASIMRYEF